MNVANQREFDMIANLGLIAYDERMNAKFYSHFSQAALQIACTLLFQDYLSI